jgi:hypothetical protein
MEASMALNRVDKERINDSRLKIQAAAETLNDVNPSKIPDFEGIQECLENAGKNLTLALRTSDVEA